MIKDKSSKNSLNLKWCVLCRMVQKRLGALAKSLQRASLYSEKSFFLSIYNTRKIHTYMIFRQKHWKCYIYTKRFFEQPLKICFLSDSKERAQSCLTSWSDYNLKFQLGASTKSEMGELLWPNNPMQKLQIQMQVSVSKIRHIKRC